jgi:CO/xanthine dehydrogenase Mo-binding subunit
LLLCLGLPGSGFLGGFHRRGCLCRLGGGLLWFHRNEGGFGFGQGIDLALAGNWYISGKYKTKSKAGQLVVCQSVNGNQQNLFCALVVAEPSESRDAMTSNSWGAVFAEVAVDKNTHMVKVRRVVATYDIGTLLNNKTGLNQLMGGITWGVSFALHEGAHIDPVYGRVVNESLAEYHVPVNVDIGTMDVTVLKIQDIKFNPIGSRGIGEIGTSGTAVANAIYNATGKRIREYPITPDKIMTV